MIGQPVIGLDTASSRFHWVSSTPLWDGSGEGEDPAQYGFCQIAGKAEADERRHVLFRTARSFFNSLPQGGAYVFCEEPLALQNGKTTRLLGLAAGAIWAAHLDFDVTWFWVDVAHWKKEVVGRGNASKDDIRAFCLENPAFRREPQQVYESEPDLYDAWCLKTYGVRQLRGAT